MRSTVDRFARWCRLRAERHRLFYRLCWSSLGQRLEDEIRFPEVQTCGPDLPPYHGMAPVWDSYSSAVIPKYPAFLTALARYYRLDLRSVLDLACGTGTLTVRLADLAPSVVGLDACEPMLAVARDRPDAPAGVSWVRGDFRDFTLDAQFDAAVCASNSLNYVADVGELRQVFRAVARHLRPGGLFVFDTSTTYPCGLLWGKYLHAKHNGQRFVIGFDYDVANRRQVGKVYLPAGVETHIRIPLDPQDIKDAAKGTGLVMDDHFPRYLFKTVAFFVLRKPAD